VQQQHGRSVPAVVPDGQRQVPVRDGEVSGRRLHAPIIAYRRGRFPLVHPTRLGVAAIVWVP
jgi:hypothetical protein